MFELDDEIEVSRCEDFSKSANAYFLVDEWQSKYAVKRDENRYHVIDKEGHVHFYQYARKIEKKVAVCINFKVYEISEGLADKIIAGECNV